ncbi:MAG: flagellar hook-associated protein FlgL [candidate division Zixibacteria bacterium]|jgi:flagellar hook-associated protein 3 FlgL|nr:flagellar hook-associated protein FlgL [candidate division Zixibacteria bacterium]
MRVTNNMISNRVVFNMQRSLGRFFDLETQMSSGRRINKPSDDPSGTLRDLNYRTELAKIEQYQKNISQALNWTATYDQVLADTKNFVSEAKEIAVAMSNDTYDDIAREASAGQIRSLIDQITSLANTRLEDRAIFAGHRTRITPFNVNATGAVYGGNNGQIEFEVDNGQRLSVNLPGDDVFLKRLGRLGEDSDLNIGVTGATLLNTLRRGDGVDQASGFTVTDRNLNITATIDLSDPAITTIDQALAKINADLAAAGITDLTAEIGPDGNNILWNTTPSGLVSGATELDRLHGGAGVVTEPGVFRVFDGGIIDITVNVSDAETLDDVITMFNDAMNAASGSYPELANVSMTLNAAGTGLQIDDTNVPPVGLQIEDALDGNSIAQQLGIAGTIGAQRIGDDLNPGSSFAVSENGGTTAADLGLRAEFLVDHPGSDLDALLTVDSLIDSISAGNGFDRGEIVIWQGERNLVIDLEDPTIVTIQDVLDRLNGSALDITATINEAGTGIQIENNDPTRSLTVEDGRESRAAKDLGIYGSTDMVGTMIMLANALDNNDRDGAGRLLAPLDASIEAMLDARGTVGTRTVRLETTNTRLVDMHLSFTRLLSEVEDADLTDVLTKLSTYEANYQSALIAGAKIIQPSLLDFLNG